MEQWIIKIIKESKCKQAFLIMPVSRWDKSEAIKQSLKSRRAKHERILKYDYNESEFRKARTLVGVYKIDFCDKKDYYSRDEPLVDPFYLWFDENFKINETKETDNSYEKKCRKKKSLQKELI